MPMLWDKKKETVVNNESSEIIRMFYHEFDDLLPEKFRKIDYLPKDLEKEIDEMNEWVYNTVNNGVYKCGFATSQEAYETNLFPLFKSLDRLEEHLGQPGHSPYLFGNQITEADIRLYTTIARFDVAYYNIFNCNLKMIRYGYPRLDKWYRNLYYDESERTSGGVFRKTTYFEIYKWGYLMSLGKIRNPAGSTQAQKPPVIPKGPVPSILPQEA